ncbi:hypothetical protein ACE1OE_00585 [Vibrio sp. E150_011]
MNIQTTFTAPHYKALQEILDAGGTPSEAMVAAALMMVVQHPNIN